MKQPGVIADVSKNQIASPAQGSSHPAGVMVMIDVEPISATRYRPAYGADPALRRQQSVEGRLCQPID
jgi:hypothetical protein